MKIKQFEDKDLAHYAYAILSECEQRIILIDPARNPQPYYDFARQHDAQIVGVIETHPHADFVSSHLEIHKKTKATIYVSQLVEANYPHQPLDEGNTLTLGKITLRALNTPGHSPDSISVVLAHEGQDQAVFTGDTLFIGDVGRPDLRENAGNLRGQREELARQMYHSTRKKLIPLGDHVVVYPAHGAGSLCGKAMSDANQSTIEQEKKSNPALQEMSENEFVAMLLRDQPFIPKYFSYDVDLNKQGAPDFQSSVAGVLILPDEAPLEPEVPVVDTRSERAFKQGHTRGAINLQNGRKFETWLGSVIGPDEAFYLLAADEDRLRQVIEKAAKIGYESKIKGGAGVPAVGRSCDVDYRCRPLPRAPVGVRHLGRAQRFGSAARTQV